MKKLAAAAALLAAVALAGCAPGNQSPAPEKPASAAPAVVPSAAPGDVWANEIVNLFLNGHGAHSFAAFQGSPLAHVETWSAEGDGVLVVTIGGNPGAFKKSDYLNAAMDFMGSAGYENKTLSAVKVASTEGRVYAQYGRADMKNANPWSV